MILFENYYDLYLEKVLTIDQVPVTELGFYNKIVDIPDKKPYGFWMDKHGNFLPVEYMRHEEAAKTVIELLKKKFGVDLPLVGNWYTMAFSLGWVRLITGCSSNTLYYDKGKNSNFTNSQMRNMKFMQQFYDLDGIEQD